MRNTNDIIFKTQIKMWEETATKIWEEKTTKLIEENKKILAENELLKKER